MKRKDWKIKSLKKDFFGKKKKIFKFKYLKERGLFLRKLFLKKNKYLIRKDLFINFILYKYFLNSFKNKKQNYFFNVFFRTDIKNLNFLPTYSINKNIFNKKLKFKKLQKNYNLNIIYSSNKFINKSTNTFGLNYYIIFKKKNFDLFDFNKDLLDENNLNLLFYKNIVNYNFKYDFNYIFNYNLHNNCLLEMYKIIILLNLNLLKN